MHESEKWKWNRSVLSNLATPRTAAYQAPPSTGFSRQEDWSGMPLPSLSQSTREIQIKTTVRYHLKPIRKAIIKKSTNNKCWKDCEEKGNTVDENVNWYSHHGEQYGGSLKKTKNRATIWSTNSILGYVSGENYNSKRYMHPNVHRSTIYNRQDKEAT